MKKTMFMVLSAISSLVSISAYAGSEIQCEYSYRGDIQLIKFELLGNRYGDGVATPFMTHKSTGKQKNLNFGTRDLEIETPGRDKRMQNWIYIKAESDIAQRTFHLDLAEGTISIEKNGRTLLENKPLSCRFIQGGE